MHEISSNSYRKQYKKLNMDINESKFTYDGIDVCGERAAIQVRI